MGHVPESVAPLLQPPVPLSGDERSPRRLALPDERLTREDFVRRPERHQHVACRGVGPSTFVRGARGNYDAVRALCGDSPVRAECLEVALADDSLVGLWGGTTEVERPERPEMRRGRVA